MPRCRTKLFSGVCWPFISLQGEMPDEGCDLVYTCCPGTKVCCIGVAYQEAVGSTLSSALFCKLSLQESAGLSPVKVLRSPWSLADSGRSPAGLKQQIWPMSHQHSPGFESCRSLQESAGVRQTPPEYVGQCKVLSLSHTTFSKCLPFTDSI